MSHIVAIPENDWMRYAQTSTLIRGLASALSSGKSSAEMLITSNFLADARVASSIWYLMQCDLTTTMFELLP
jgi:hypothetical protein